MKRHVVLVVSFLLTLSLFPGFAQPSEEPPEPTPYFFDNFDNGPKPEWNPVDGDWTMISGMYTLAAVTNRYLYFSILENRDWTDLVLTVDIRPGDTGGFFNEAIIFPRITPPKKKSEGNFTKEIGVGGIGFFIDAQYGRFVKGGWGKITNGLWADPLEVIKIKRSPGEPIHIRIDVEGSLYTAYANGAFISQIYDDDYPSGKIGIGQWYEHWYRENPKVAFDNIWVGPPQYAGGPTSEETVMQAAPAKAAEGPGEYGPDASKNAKEASDAAFRAEKAAFQAEQAAKNAQEAARKAEGKAKKVEDMIEAK